MEHESEAVWGDDQRSELDGGNRVIRFGLLVSLFNNVPKM